MPRGAQCSTSLVHHLIELIELVESRPYLSRGYSMRPPTEGGSFDAIKVILTRHMEKLTSAHQEEENWKVPNSTEVIKNLLYGRKVRDD